MPLSKNRGARVCFVCIRKVQGDLEKSPPGSPDLCKGSDCFYDAYCKRALVSTGECQRRCQRKDIGGNQHLLELTNVSLRRPCLRKKCSHQTHTHIMVVLRDSVCIYQPYWGNSFTHMCVGVLSCSVVPDSLGSHRLQPARLLCPCNSPGKNTGVGSLSLLQGIFLTQESNPGLVHCRQILYHLSYQYQITLYILKLDNVVCSSYLSKAGGCVKKERRKEGKEGKKKTRKEEERGIYLVILFSIYSFMRLTPTSVFSFIDCELACQMPN